MDFPLYTDALLYVVVAKSILAVLLIIAAIAALFVGARLFLRGLELTPDDPEHPNNATIGFKRLHKDTWLPRGSQIRGKDDTESFTRLDKDTWVMSGSLVRIELTDMETKRNLQMTGGILMASALLWGWLAYLSSPLDIQRINRALAMSQEHKLHILLSRLQQDTVGLHSQLSAVQSELQSLHNDTAQQAKQGAKAEHIDQLLQSNRRAASSLNEEIEILQISLDTMNTRLADTQKLDVLQSTLDDSIAQLGPLSAGVDTLQAELQTVKTLAADYQPLENLHNSLERSLQQTQGHFDSGIGRLREAFDQAQVQSHALNSEQIQSVQQQLQQTLKQQQEDLQHRLTQLETLDTEQNQAQLSLITEDLQHLQQQLQALKPTPTDTTASAEVSTQLEQMQTQLHSLQTASEYPPEPLQAIAQQVQDLQERLPVLQTTLDNMQTHLSQQTTGTDSMNALQQQLDLLVQRSEPTTTSSSASMPVTDEAATSSVPNTYDPQALTQLQHQISTLQDTLKAAPAPATEAADNSALQADIQAIKQQVQHLPKNLNDIQGSIEHLRKAVAHLETVSNTRTHNINTLSQQSQPPAAPINTAATLPSSPAPTTTADDAVSSPSDTDNVPTAAPTHPLVQQLLAADAPKLDNGMSYVDIPVSFASGSANQLGDTALLQTLGESLKSPHMQDKHILIQGFTDSLGGANTNLRLSERRAQFVRQWLLKNFELSPERLEAEGKGEENPIASNATATGREKNRRVRILIK